MDWLSFDLAKIIGPDISVPEIVFRGTVMYFLIYLLLRLVMRGRTGGTTMSELLVVVLIADAAQNGMADDYHSVVSGGLLVATIIGWSFVMDWTAYRLPVVQRFVHPEQRPLVQNGRLIRRTLAREMITEDELMSEIRVQGIDRLEDVRAVYLEGNGQISVIPSSK
jgi:uncharacterized membrane protein YcaP (DUF421 family)